MAIAIKESLYFDVLSRSDKGLVLKALATATLNSTTKEKDEIAKELVDALNTIRTRANGTYGRIEGAGTYSGSVEQFMSQYTQGLEFGVWRKSKGKFILSKLALDMAEEKLNSIDYLTIVMLNYIQIINNTIISPLEECMKIVCSNSDLTICKEEINSNTIFCNGSSENRDANNLLFNILSEIRFFNKISNTKLKFFSNKSLANEVLNLIQKYKITEEVELIKVDFLNQEIYTEYITRVNIEFINFMNKNFSSNLSIVNLQDNDDMLLSNNEEFIFKEDKELPRMIIPSEYKFKSSKKIDFLEKNKRQAKIGQAAEKIIFDMENKKVKQIDSSLKATWVSKELGDGLGYDIKSYQKDNQGNIIEIFIEVKATTGAKDTPIEITRNEVEFSKHKKDSFRIIRIYDFNLDVEEIKYYVIKGDVSKLNLISTNYRLYLT